MILCIVRMVFEVIPKKSENVVIFVVSRLKLTRKKATNYKLLNFAVQQGITAFLANFTGNYHRKEKQNI